MGLLEAVAMAKKSQDPSTQCGASIWDGHGFPVSRGFNGPVCVPNDTAYGYDRETKYQHIEHAERMAVYAAALRGRRTLGGTMFTTWAACQECSKAIIVSGIERVVTLQRTHDATPPRWKDAVDRGLWMMKNSGVDVVMWDKSLSTPDEEVYIKFNQRILTL